MVHKRQKGFTIVELMIAITVLSVAMLLFTFGAIQISRSYQQATIRVKLSDTTREVHSDFTQNLQFSGLNVQTTQPLGGTYEVTCLGSVRYVRYSTATQTDANYGLLFKQDLSGGTTCTSAVNIANMVSVLPSGSRAVAFSMSESAGIFTLTTRFVSGERDRFNGSDYTKACNGITSGGQFCAAIDLSSIITRKVQ